MCLFYHFRTANPMDFEQDVKNAAAILRSGGVILYPTDTIWGLGCDAMQEAAIEKLYTIKKRPREKAMIVLLASSKDILQYIASPPPDIIDVLDNFDRPTTVIYQNPLGFPDNLTGDVDTLAIRVTSDPFCKALIKRIQSPLVSTSANFSGEPSPAIFQDINPEIVAQADYVVSYRQDDTSRALPSRIVSLDDEGNITVIRP
jgi:L-threonylcarbamoyladenylate synthase